jgi:hypothetical protein
VSRNIWGTFWAGTVDGSTTGFIRPGVGIGSNINYSNAGGACIEFMISNSLVVPIGFENSVRNHPYRKWRRVA